jgi:hypothetical protein
VTIVTASVTIRVSAAVPASVGISDSAPNV